jgi:hypothetical protein
MYTIKFTDLTDRAYQYIKELTEQLMINIDVIPCDIAGDLWDVKISGISPVKMPGIMIRIFHHIDQDQYKDIVIN